jgi:hypothetical protein
VVFRGKLGDEEDAVTVAAKPLANPIFFTVMNETDYVHLSNKKCYTREQIIADDALWGILAPDCKKYLDPSAPREFSDSCKATGKNVEIEFGWYGSNLYTLWADTDGGLPVRRFGRIVFLTDDEQTDLAVYFTDKDWYVEAYSDFSYKNLASSYYTYWKHRGIYGANSFILVENGRDGNGGDASCTAGYLSSDDPTDLQVDELFPLSVTDMPQW